MTTSPVPGWHHHSGVEAAGPLLVRPRVLSPELHNFRTLVVALPASYHRSDRRYPVVYMQDGQNLFDPATAYAGDWRLADSLRDLDADGVEAIVVGIFNAGPDRLHEYSPEPDRRLGGGRGRRYLDFVTGTVKPLIDRDFRTRPDRTHTAIAGSSMGGLISLWAWLRHSDVFGAVGALSPSLWFADRAILDAVSGARHLAPSRLYLDIGLDEPGQAVADVRRLRDLLARHDHLADRVTLDYLEDAGGVHDEAAWGRRVTRALPFLIGRPAGPAPE